MGSFDYAQDDRRRLMGSFDFGFASRRMTKGWVILRL
jgi:hypothetical protein